MTLLKKIDSPYDLKKLSLDEMKTLAQEIRDGILNRVNKIGGHCSPNLGIVEATIALHYVFNSPVDKFIFDVSHQCYTHKMLTGRKSGFVGDIIKNISGFFNPNESEHDTFVLGHTSTSLSLASGVAKARDINGDNYNVIALIGDGSLSGGEAFEGLNNAAMLNSNFIIVVNDNEMSISENQGGLYKNLRELRESNGTCQNNFFKTFGYDYHYLEEGNDLEKLIELFSQAKDTTKPVVLHIHTLKGNGYTPAEENKEMFHNTVSGRINGKTPVIPANLPETYGNITTDFILKKREKDKSIVAITAATPGGVSFTKDFRQKMGDAYIDVAISEEHAMGFTSGLAKNGAKPIFAVQSSFVQRTYDQISQDIALNNSPVTVVVYCGGMSGIDMTHLGTFDISMISNIPNIVYLAPTNKEEYLSMLDWSIEQVEHPVFIRVPLGEPVVTGKKDKTNYSNLNKYQVVEKGSEIAIVALGTFFQLGEKVVSRLKQAGFNPTLINPKYITGLDEDLLEGLKDNHNLVITLEDGILDGGFGQKIASFYGDSDMKVLNYGGKKEFTDRTKVTDLYERYHLTPELIFEDIMKQQSGKLLYA